MSFYTKASNTINEFNIPPDKLALKNIDFNIGRRITQIGLPRASSLYKACMRMHVIGYVNKIKKYDSIPNRSKVTFLIGNSVHESVQNTNIAFPDNTRIGLWRCLSCGAVSKFGIKPKKCSCGAKKDAFLYEEYTFVINRGKYLFTAHPDLFIRKREWKNKIRVVELKTISGNEFEKLKAPIIDHVWQVNSYILASRLDKNFTHKVDDTGYIIYFSKRQHRDILPIKMFAVRREKAIDSRIKSKLLSFRVGVKNYPEKITDPLLKCVEGNFDKYISTSCPCMIQCKELFYNGK